MDSRAFARIIAEVVNEIPSGKVLTYGDVAALAGWPSHARLVGKVLGVMGFDSPVPCHRVVNAQGRTAPHWPRQIELLKSEGVEFSKANLVIMKKFRWMP